MNLRRMPSPITGPSGFPLAGESLFPTIEELETQLPAMYAPSRLLVLPLLAALSGPVQAVRGRPPAGYRPPVIEKVQIVFSLVTHFNSIADRVSFYNNYGSPRGNQHYAVPHLVYEPRITLYNPYPDPLTLDKVRIRIWDPPVGFRFKKNGDYLRNIWSSGGFAGLAQLQIANESNPNARKYFTLMLRESHAGQAPVHPFTLQPGESREFGTWTENNWTWGMETEFAYSPRNFFDWNASLDFTNIDGRNNNPFGSETAQGVNLRAGFQTDSLSSNIARPLATRYDFEIERNYTGNWVSIKLTDTVSVESRAMRTVASSTEPDFRISLLGGYVIDPTRDNYQEFAFDLDSLAQPPTDSPTEAAVSRTWLAGDLLQTATDMNPGGKTPFAVLTAAVKASSVLDGSLSRLADMDGNDHYDLRFDEVADFSDIPDIRSLEQVPDVAEPTVLGVVRVGDELRVDFLAPNAALPLHVTGGTSPENLTDDLSEVSAIIPAPHEPTTDNRKTAIIDVSGMGPKYFVRIEEEN